MNILPNDIKYAIEEEVREYNFKELMKQMKLKFHYKKVLAELLYNEKNYKVKWGIDRLGQAEMSPIDYNILLTIDNHIELSSYHSVLGLPKFPVKSFKKAYNPRSSTNRWEKYHYTRTVPNVTFHEKCKRVDVSYAVWMSREEEDMDMDIFGTNINENYVGETEILTNVQNDKKELQKLLDFYDTILGDFYELNWKIPIKKQLGYVISDDALHWNFGQINEIEEIQDKLMWAYDPKTMKEICCVSDSDFSDEDYQFYY